MWLESNAPWCLDLSAPQAVPREPLERHAQAVRRIAERLSLPPSADGLLSAVLAERAAQELSEAHREAASGLAQLGADVLAVGILCAQVREAACGELAGDPNLVWGRVLSLDRLAGHFLVVARRCLAARTRGSIGPPLRRWLAGGRRGAARLLRGAVCGDEPTLRAASQG
jgi:hypothetical protein